MSERSRYAAAVVLRPQAPGRVLAAVTALVVLAAAGAMAIFGMQLAGLIAFPVMLLVGALVQVSRMTREARRPKATSPRNGEIGVEGRELVVRRARGRGEARIPVASLESGHVVPDAGGKGARIVLRDHAGIAVDAWLEDADDARALLGELGLSPLERPSTFSFYFNLRVTVGVDGVVVAVPLFGRRKFIPHARIDDVRWTPESVSLLLTNGRRFDIATAGARGGTGDDHDALVERLIAARDAYRASVGGEPVQALARGGRTADAWVRELRAMSDAAGSQYRTASLPTETLWRIALDPAEKEELRIGAGLALRGGLDDEGRLRLRGAAEAAASPRVRVALEAAADGGSDEAIAHAIDDTTRSRGQS